MRCIAIQRYIIRFLLILMVSVVIAVGCRRQVSVLGVNENDASSAIAVTEEKLELSYEAVAGAAAAGANVSGLLTRLNEAGEFLSMAELSYQRGDFNTAVDLADASQNKLEGSVGEAEALMEKAMQDNRFGFLTAVGSGVGAVCIVSGGFVVWFLLKKHGESRRVVD